MDQQNLPDLSGVEEKIREARGAEDDLMDVMPSAIQPDDDVSEGMSGPTETDVQETDDARKTDDERQAESPQGTPTEQVQDHVLDTETVDDKRRNDPRNDRLPD